MGKAEAGRLGGLATVKRHGREHMQRIGREGARRFHDLYSLKPYGTHQWAIVRRSDNVIIGYTLDWRLNEQRNQN